MVTGYLGPKGTYSELAHDKFFTDTKKMEFNSFYAIFKAVSEGKIDAAVLPIENALQGSVTECLDLLFEYKELYLTREVQIPIIHRLIVQKGAEISDIKTVYSHEQAIKQCAKFLSEKLPSARVITTSSTAASAAQIKDKTAAGIVGSHFSAQGLEFLDFEIPGVQNNVTRFCVLEKGEEKLRPDTTKIFIAAGGKNKPGALLKLLTILNKYKLNMTKIESRPLKTTIGEYVFFIEFEGSISHPKKNAALALDKVRQAATEFKLLGCY